MRRSRGAFRFGLLTLYSLFVNGMLLGVIGAACHHYGMSLALWSFVAAHGSLELPSIIIAGAAGLRLGHAMLFPGGYRWKDSLAKGGIEATRLVSGIIPLLVIAGCLEGFFSPSPRAGVAEVHRGRRAVCAAEFVAVPSGEGKKHSRMTATTESESLLVELCPELR